MGDFTDQKQKSSTKILLIYQYKYHVGGTGPVYTLEPKKPFD